MRFQEVSGVLTSRSTSGSMKFQGLSTLRSTMGFRNFQGFQLQVIHEVSGCFRGFR